MVKTEEGLKSYIKEVFGFNIPNRKICDEHCSPYDFFSDVYFERTSDPIAWACRSGGKTLGVAILLTDLCLRHRGYDSRILGGSQDQSERVYEHIKRFAESRISGYIEGDPKVTRTFFKNGSRIETLAASPKSVMGPHPVTLILDEADELDKDVYNAALGMPQSTPEYKSKVIITSTMHNPWGMMSDIVDNAHEEGRKVYRWCIWEILESCKDYECETCPLFEDCQGRGKPDEFQGYFKIEDAIRKKQQLSREAWEANYLCKRPSVTGATYAEFVMERHVKENLIYDHNVRTVAGCDFGFDPDPMVCLIAQVVDGVVNIIDEYYKLRQTASDFAITCLNYKDMYQIEKFYCDPSGKAAIAEMNNILSAGSAEGKRVNISDGVEMIRSRLKNGTLAISPKCTNLIREIQSYKVYDPKDDHCLDALKYMLEGIGHTGNINLDYRAGEPFDKPQAEKSVYAMLTSSSQPLPVEYVDDDEFDRLRKEEKKLNRGRVYKAKETMPTW